MKINGIFLNMSVIVFLSGCNPFNMPAAKEGFSTISKMEIKRLVMNIEFYKLQNGHYPDNLEQLQVLDPLAPVTDAVQGAQMKANVLYNYEKIGEKYSLFSSGIDGIPGTKDDFYPDITIPDSSKIGLVNKN
jgi:hypothetical protein